MISLISTPTRNEVELQPPANGPPDVPPPGDDDHLNRAEQQGNHRHVILRWCWRLDRAANRLAVQTGRLAAWATRRAMEGNR